MIKSFIKLDVSLNFFDLKDNSLTVKKLVLLE